MKHESETEAAREAHLGWCKNRAMEYFNAGDLENAVASMVSDLGKREDTRCNPSLALLGMMYVMKYDFAGVKHWIEGFR